MTEIQVIFLFTSQKQLTLEQKDRVKAAVKDAYIQLCNPKERTVDVNLYDGQAINNPNDIVLAINSDKHILNEGSLRGKMRDSLAKNLLSFSFMNQLGFSGKIGLKDGRIDAGGDNKNEEKAINPNSSMANIDNTDYKQRAKQYVAVEAKYSFDRLKISQETMEQIDRALARIQYEREVFDGWGLYAIMPSPVCAMSFYGAPGTGKSMAAEAIASRLKKPIIRASYADIENKYVGEGPKNVSAIFIAAEEQDAVLFIDEADSLLSKRLVNVSDPSGQAMNSMRSQLLISLENYHGIVIFATNLAVNYDRAFVSRLINIEFKIPDVKTREEIWKAHIYPSRESKVQLRIPLAKDVDLKYLAANYDFVGRDIRNSVVDACVMAHMRGLKMLTQDCLIKAADSIVDASKKMENAKDMTARGIQHTYADAINVMKDNSSPPTVVKSTELE